MDPQNFVTPRNVKKIFKYVTSYQERAWFYKQAEQAVKCSKLIGYN